MNLAEIIQRMNLKLLTTEKDFSQINPTGGYTSDLLSCVMAGAPPEGIWVTLQAHNNIVAVAALRDLAAVIITEGATPDPVTIAKANEEGITLLSTDQTSYFICGTLWELGIRMA